MMRLNADHTTYPPWLSRTTLGMLCLIYMSLATLHPCGDQFVECQYSRTYTSAVSDEGKFSANSVANVYRVACLLSNFSQPNPTIPSFHRMSGPSRSSNNEGRRGGRPVLPPIRDLFPDQLAGHSQGSSQEPPYLTLAQLRVSDDDDRSPRPPSRLIGPGYHPSTHFPTASAHQHPRDPVQPHPRHPQAYQYPRYDSPDPSSQRQDRRQPSRHDVDSRAEHHRGLPGYPYDPQMPQGYPHGTAARGTEAAYGNRQGHPSWDVPPTSYRMGTPQAYYGSAQDAHPHRPRTTVQTSMGYHRSTEDEERTPTILSREGASSSTAYTHAHRPSTAESTSDAPDSSSAKYECEYCGKGFNRPSSLKVRRSFKPTSD